MQLNNDDLYLLSQCAISAAYQAGHLISKHTDIPLDVENKPGGESKASQVLTKVDRLAQDLILQLLEPTISVYDLGLLTEESEDDSSRFEKKHFWCIDPLDGTLSFIESTPGYSVSIALVAQDGTPQIGVVYDPVLGNLYHAVKGQGVFRNGQPWKPALEAQHATLTMASDRSFLDHARFAEIEMACIDMSKDLGNKNFRLIKHGGGAMNACWVLENQPGCYFKFPKPGNGGGSLWDYAATACIFIEAGAVASDIHGQALDLNRKDSTYMNHRGILYATSQEIAEKIRNIFKKLS